MGTLTLSHTRAPKANCSHPVPIHVSVRKGWNKSTRVDNPRGWLGPNSEHPLDSLNIKTSLNHHSIKVTFCFSYTISVIRPKFQLLKLHRRLSSHKNQQSRWQRILKLYVNGKVSTTFGQLDHCAGAGKGSCWLGAAVLPPAYPCTWFLLDKLEEWGEGGNK